MAEGQDSPVAEEYPLVEFLLQKMFLVRASSWSRSCFTLACDDLNAKLVPSNDEASDVVVLRRGAYELVQHMHHV